MMPFGTGLKHPGWPSLGMAVIALAGIVIGAATVSTGTEGILEEYGLEGTVFGATIITAVLTIEDLFLTVEPIRRGVPEIGVGNVIGSLVFTVTGKLGIIVIAGGSVTVASNVLKWHLPALVFITAVAALLPLHRPAEAMARLRPAGPVHRVLGDQLHRVRRRAGRGLTRAAIWRWSRAGRPGGRPRIFRCRRYSGSANANSALPWDDPSILGRNPSAQPPQPLGATMYCRPSTL